MNADIQPLQTELQWTEGSPEGRLYGDPGVAWIDRLTGKWWRKTTSRDLNTGWLEMGSGGGGGGGYFTKVGTAFIGGDQSGNARGAYALDVQSYRGYSTQVASGGLGLAIGASCMANGYVALAVGNYGYASGVASAAFGTYNLAQGRKSSAFGYHNISSGEYSVAFGSGNAAPYGNASAVGVSNQANGLYASAFGYSNTASAVYSAAVGSRNNAYGAYSLAIGQNNTSAGAYGSAFGYLNRASGLAGSSAFGYENVAAGKYSSAFGFKSSASGDYSSAFGYSNTASGDYSAAFGQHCSSSGGASLAFGIVCAANAYGSLALGYKAKASVDHTTVISGAQIIPKYTGALPPIYLVGVETILTTGEVDLTVASDFTLNLPSGSHFWIDEADLIVTSINTMTVQPTISVGITGNTTKYQGATLTTDLTAQFKRQRFSFTGTDGETSLVASITVGATAIAMKGRFLFRGILVEDQ